MIISEEDIKQFKQLYEQVEGKEITDEEAVKMISALVLIIGTVYKPIPLTDKEELEGLIINNKTHE